MLDFTSVTFDGVTRHFGRRRALHGVSFTVRAGQIVALLGANGSGKSTLLSIAATLLEPSGGEVRYGDLTSSRHGAPLRARIGLLAHDLYIYPELTAAENLRFFANLYGIKDADARVRAALADAALTDRADDPAGSLSRGMRQRLALERALLHRPRLLLLDEPFTGLDDVSATALQRRLTEERERGAVVLITTHELEAIEAIADEAIVLTGGRAMPLPAGAGTLRDRYRTHA